MSGLDDMDLDGLGGAKKAPDRPRFAPKNAKLKLPVKLKAKVNTELHDQQLPQSQGIISANVTKNEEFDIKPKSPLSASNESIKMEIDVKMEEKEQKLEDVMEKDIIEKKEDRVIREYDVYSIPEICPDVKLYNFQYPLRPTWRPYDLDERCEDVRIHKTKLAFEMDLSIDTTSKNYDASHDPTRKKTSQTLTSVMSSPDTETGATLAFARLIGNKLYITPIHATVQFRPSLEHSASVGSSTEVAVTSSVEGSKKSEDVKDEKSDWSPLKYHGARSDHASSYLKKIAVQNDTAIQFNMSPLDYIDSMCPPKVNNDKPKGPSRRDLLSFPLEERYKTWLIEGPHINRFDTLKHLAPNEADEDVLKVLQKYATLVQGLWVTKTALLADVYKGPKSLARDYVLLLFRKNNLISYDEIKATGPFGKFMTEPLTSLAIERPSLKDWKFKEPTDFSFIKFHEKIVEVQDQSWEAAEKKILPYIFKGRGEPGIKGSGKAADRAAAVQIPNKNMASNPAGAGSKDSMSNETREALPKALHKLFQAHKHCSFQQICQRLREMAVSESSRPKGMAKEAMAAASAVDAHRSELVEMIEQVAIDIHGVYVPKTSYDHPDFDPFRNVVIGLLIVEGAKAKLRKGTIMETAKIQLGRDITPTEYQTVMNELCTSSGPIWVLKNNDGSSK